MTAEERAALRELHRSAAAGTWHRGPDGQILAVSYEPGRPMRRIATMAGWATSGEAPWPTAELLVAARNALPELLDEADARQEALDAALATGAELAEELKGCRELLQEALECMEEAWPGRAIVSIVRAHLRKVP